MNRNTHGEERRKVEKALSIAIMDRWDQIVRWSVTFVGQLRSLVSCVCWSNCDVTKGQYCVIS
ncbi:hypothetical protein T4D_2840 [Trichinella pseudospiralis]|uniref:Uncharacterized protein n=1 Tax=Trichinella pseudospiralis TaxID=6337 RepID=A0A0V1F2H2_TRIPS|nr:hypothetical protein T4D_2840 [Trichinella pseudospiralis]